MVQNFGYGRVGINSGDRQKMWATVVALALATLAMEATKVVVLTLATLAMEEAKVAKLATLAMEVAGGSVGFESYLQFANLLSTMNLTCNKRHVYPHEHT